MPYEVIHCNVRFLLTLSLNAAFSFSLTCECLMIALALITFTLSLGLNGDVCHWKLLHLSFQSTSYQIYNLERIFLCKESGMT